jgi:hypothetical protein
MVRFHMMHLIHSSLRLSLVVALAACSINADAGGTPPTQPSPPQAPSPAVAAQVKDIVISNLPAPFYHFEYDATGRVTRASFASGFESYSLAYTNGHLNEMHNNALGNTDRLTYTYDEAGRVSTVKYIDPTDTVFTVVFLGYAGQQLTMLERDRRVDGGWIVEKTMAFAYDVNGNVSDVVEHHPAIAELQEATTVTDHYDDYDNGLNVDGFSLLHSEFFDHLVLLPQVTLQKNNPRSVVHTGGSENFRVNYSYIYDAQHRPTNRNGTISILSGTNSGQVFPTTTTLSYY